MKTRAAKEAESDAQWQILVRQTLHSATRRGFTIPLFGAHEFIAEFLACVVREAKERRVLLPGLGVFEFKVRKSRIVRNPRTKELMKLPETRCLKFRPSRMHRAVKP